MYKIWISSPKSTVIKTSLSAWPQFDLKKVTNWLFLCGFFNHNADGFDEYLPLFVIVIKTYKAWLEKVSSFS